MPADIIAKDFAPRPYQKLITDFILENERCAVFAGMGLGKSVSTLNALETLLLVDPRPVLVVAPLRVATTTWPDEVRKWTHLSHLAVVPICGNEKARLRALRYDAPIFTVNFEQLPWLVEHFGDRWPFATVVIDESTKLKGFRLRQGTQRAKALGRVAHTKIKRLVELTGTPAPNGLIDLWGQAWFLDKGERLGRTFDSFKQRWFQKSFDGFGSVPLDHAQDQIQRALRDICLTIDAKDWFDLKEPIVNNIYIDLPAKARALYDDMEKRMFMELSGHEVEAFGAAQRTIKCIAEGTELLTSNGWKPIEQWRPGDMLWDGVEWVNARNLVCNGSTPVVKCLHVTMTPDHKVLTISGWKTAEEINSANASRRLNRAPVRLPDNFKTPWDYRGDTSKAGHLAGSVYLRKRIRGDQYKSAKQKPGVEKILRMPAGGNASRRVGNPRNDGAPRMDILAEHEITVLQSARQRLAQLRRTRDFGVRTLAVVRRFLAGYGADVFGRTNARAFRQFGKLRAKKLRMGESQSASQQYSSECFHRYTRWAHDSGASGRTVRRERRNPTATLAARLADGKSINTSKVYDLVNCGPRHRFTVRGSDGKLLIVHNCLQICNGAAYVGDGGKEWAEVHDAKIAALEDVVEEACGMPVLVAYQFKSDLARLQAAFGNAAITLNSAEAIRRAQQGEGKVWLGHPASMGHGVDGLQNHCNQLCFFGHDWNLENRLQIIERVGPTRQMQAGKDRPMFIHNLIARDTVDEMVIERVNTKREVQDILLDAMKVKGYR